MKALIDRFNDKWTPEPNSGCWLWITAVAGHGYGVMSVENRQQYGHRVSWMIHFGDIPKGMHVCHHCDTPACVNPSHLFLGSRLDNQRDSIRKGRNSCGSRHPGSKLSEAAVAQIFMNKQTHEQIARDYGVSREAISQIKQGRTWRHVTKALPRES